MKDSSAASLPGPPSDPALEAVAQARGAGLRYACPGEPGIRRVRSGAALRYLGPDGAAIHDEATLRRIRALAIPPAYKHVWICADPRGHLQAVGRDARGRRQYRYHAQWRTTRDGAKFDRMIEFGEALPRLRRRLRRDLALPGLPQDKVLAVIVALLDESLARIGSAEYARDNGSFGLSTLRNRHATFIRDGRARLHFRGKGGAEQEIVVGDRRLARIVRRCQQLPGQHLFQYVDDEGRRRPVDSGQVNDYLARAIGPGFTAKDFRTWGATRRAIALMRCTPLPAQPGEAAITTCIAAAVRQVAAELGNTPAVCRKSYINPAVFEAWRDGRLHRVLRNGDTSRRGEPAALALLRRIARKRGRGNPAGPNDSKKVANHRHENRRP